MTLHKAERLCPVSPLGCNHWSQVISAAKRDASHCCASSPQIHVFPNVRSTGPLRYQASGSTTLVTGRSALQFPLSRRFRAAPSFTSSRIFSSLDLTYSSISCIESLRTCSFVLLSGALSSWSLGVSMIDLILNAVHSQPQTLLQTAPHSLGLSLIS
jgi:hypothetical protein